jgi:CRP-like cAMP-binding protein
MGTIANSLLAALPRKSYRKLLAGLAPVDLVLGDVLYEAGKPIRDVYFPGRSLVSLLTLVEGHLALEVGLVGREGMVGIPVALGIDHSPVRALVQGGGPALRMSAARFRAELRSSAPLQRALYRYVHAMMEQISQTAGCNRFHVVEARLARWLLMTRDRMCSGEFRMTHEFLYRRGNIRILDHRGLEAAACACYRSLNDMREEKGSGRRRPSTSNRPFVTP